MQMNGYFQWAALKAFKDIKDKTRILIMNNLNQD